MRLPISARDRGKPAGHPQRYRYDVGTSGGHRNVILQGK